MIYHLLFFILGIWISSAQIYMMTLNTYGLVLDQKFYFCAASRLTFENNSLFVIPYSSSQDFTKAMIYANRAGFVGLHLLIDPDEFLTSSPPAISQNIEASLQSQGLSVAGVWLNVTRTSAIWSFSQSENTELIVDIMDALSSVFTPNFVKPLLGIYTTTTDLKIVTNLNPQIPQLNIEYWSGFGDNLENCGDSPVNGFAYCKLQALRNISTCGPNIGISMFRPFMEG